MYFFVKDFSSFHPNNFRSTISWKCFLKDDCIRSSLIECQPFLNSKIDVDPIYCVLMSLPCVMQVLCMTRYTQSITSGSLLLLSVGSTSRKNTVCLLLEL